MRLGKRISLLIQAGLGRRRRRDEDRVEATLRRADKTEALLEQLGERLNRALARQIQLEGQVRQAEEMARQWDRRADEALRAGDEAAAREAIRHKLAYTQVAGELGSSLARQTAAVEGLRGDLARLESRLARLRAQTGAKSRAPSPSPPPAPPADEAADSVEALRERMSRLWSDKEIENELDAIKSRLSAGRPTD
jgi:phage shock protein A